MCNIPYTKKTGGSIVIAEAAANTAIEGEGGT
jgi:hypothetical protein